MHIRLIFSSIFLYLRLYSLEFPSQYYPKGESPRLWIKDDIERLKRVFNDDSALGTLIFKKELAKLMSYTTPCQDWRCESGWPAAALALAWKLTSNEAYGEKAISTYIPHFDGIPHVVGRLQSITHYALAFDWLQGHPSFTNNVKQNLAKKFINWSDKEFYDDTTKVSYIAQDSDHLTASTTSHFVAGVAIFGFHPNATILMDRGWTGFKKGYNNNSLIPYVSIEDMFLKTKNGHPLPGWDYFWMSDGWDLQNLLYILDELGYISEPAKEWWPRAIINFIHNVDPGNTHYRWLGDTQSEVNLSSFSGYIWSWFSNCIYNSEKYGFATEAGIGRYFLDNLTRSPWGISEGDPLLLMARGFNSSAKRINYTNASVFNLSRSIIEGIGEDQRMGYGYFRSNWGKNGTWGGVSGVGNYLVDHMHGSAGSFFLWRNGEYLTTDPHNYGGEIYGEIYNSLSIPNPLKNDMGGPLFYSNQFHAFIERGTVRTSFNGSEDLFYIVLNANGSYNLPISKWDTCGGCGQPVQYYKRHLLYDGKDLVLIIDKVNLKFANETSWRFRTQNPDKAPQIISDNVVSAPSDKGTYRSLIKIIEPKEITWNFFDESKNLKGKVPNYAIDQTMFGYEIKATTTKKIDHLWISAINIGKSSDSNEIFDFTQKWESEALVGLYVSQIIFLIAKHEVLLNETWFITPNNTKEGTKHILGDILPGYYTVFGSEDGKIGDFLVKDTENSLIFVNEKAGSQNISIVLTSPPSSPSFAFNLFTFISYIIVAILTFQ